MARTIDVCRSTQGRLRRSMIWRNSTCLDAKMATANLSRFAYVLALPSIAHNLSHNFPSSFHPSLPSAGSLIMDQHRNFDLHIYRAQSDPSLAGRPPSPRTVSTFNTVRKDLVYFLSPYLSCGLHSLGKQDGPGNLWGFLLGMASMGSIDPGASISPCKCSC